MGHPFDPGPPLEAGPETCPCDRPGAGEYVKASGAALLAILLGAAVWLAIGLAAQKVMSVTAVLTGLIAGQLVHLAARRLRSIALGIIAGGAALLASGTGYALLWLPFLGKLPVDRQLSWYHLLMLLLGSGLAYGIAGQRTKQKQPW